MVGPTILCLDKYTQIINLDSWEWALQQGDLRGKKRGKGWEGTLTGGGGGCNGFCAEAVAQASKRCNG